MEGRFLNAAGDKASSDNEQSSVGLDSPRGRILIRQIAGLVARRIVTDHAEGTEVMQGDRMGLIRFGSRVDVFLPAPAAAMVRPGDVTRAGQTVIGQWK
jgi:phosphatidylserine decarboxylase